MGLHLPPSRVGAFLSGIQVRSVERTGRSRKGQSRQGSGRHSVLRCGGQRSLEKVMLPQSTQKSMWIIHSGTKVQREKKIRER